MDSRVRPISALSKRICVGITMGDPSGVGPEVIAKALNIPGLRRLADFIIIGDNWVFLKACHKKYRLRESELVDLKNVKRRNFSFGKVNEEYGRASIEYVKKAVEILREGKIHCLVTAPISKEAINLAGYKYPGHTEYIAELTETNNFAMMLIANKLKVSLVTRHIPLKDVALSLNSKAIYETIFLTSKGLKDFFRISHPYLAVCGLNPHASDGGIIGKEEKRIIEPAIKRAREQGIDIVGPLPSDTVFYKAYKGVYDAVIAMYHDQGLIPLKMLGFDKAVNITLGLPFVRTSPGHGTAFGIAGKGIASISSMQEAIKLAITCTHLKRKEIIS